MRPSWKYTSRLLGFVIITWLFFLPNIGLGANVLKVDSAFCFPSEQVAISIEVLNDDPIVSFQVDIPIPSYFSYVQNSIALTPVRKADHIITASVVSNNVLRIISYSPGNLAYIGNSGTIATFELNASAVQGDFLLEANNAILGNTNSQNILTLAVDGNVRVMWPLSVYFSSSDDTICSGDSVYLTAAGSGGTGNYTYSWYSGNTLISLDPELWVDPTETTDYLIELTDGISAIDQSIIVYCYLLPLVYAGIDQEICSDEPHFLYGSGQNYESLLWSGGDGYFLDSTALNTVYYPGAGDISNQEVNITLTAFGFGKCTTALDDKHVDIIPAPCAFAGNDTIIQPDSVYYSTSAIASNINSLTWTSSGDGIFYNPHALHTTYHPGELDKVAGGVTLILEAEGIEQCNLAIDSVRVSFSIFADVFPNNDFGFRIFPNPVGSTGCLTLLISRKGIYSLRIIDLKGMDVMHKSLGFLMKGTHEIPLQELKYLIYSGDLFFIEITSQINDKTYRLIEKLIVPDL